MSYTTGQTVRMHAELRRDWADGRAAVGDTHTMTGVGRITATYTDSGYCALCEYHNETCPGPWYSVDFGEGDGTGFGGMYAEHELEAA